MSFPEVAPLVTLKGLVEAIVASLATVPGLREARAFPGAFDVKSSERFTAAAPAAWVGLISTGKMGLAAEGSFSADCELIVVIADKIGASSTAALQGLPLAQAIAARISGNCWGLSGVSGGRDVKIDNLTSDVMIGRGIALYGISFNQRCRIRTDATLEIEEVGALDEPAIEGLP